MEFRPHDLRRTVATMLTSSGDADRFLLKQILTRVDRDITAVYDRNRYDTEARAALQSWGRQLEALIEHRVTRNNVVSIKRR